MVAALDVQNDLRTALFERLQRLDRASRSAPDRAARVASADLALVQMLLSFLPMLTGNLVMLVMSLGVMLWLSPTLTIVTLLAVPALLVVSLKLRRKMYPAQWDSLHHAGEVAGVVDEAVTGVRVVGASARRTVSWRRSPTRPAASTARACGTCASRRSTRRCSR